MLADPETRRRDLRILVAGAGPAGATAALELARRGFRPRLIDSAEGPMPAEESRALAINLRTLELLEPSGVTQRLLEEARQIREMRIVSDDRRLITIDPTAVEDTKYRGMHVLPQGRTQAILLEALARFGIQPEWGTAFTAFSETGSDAEALLTLPDASVEVAPFDIVIGADGAHSAVRRAARLGFPGEALTELFFLADYRYAEPVDASFAEARLLNPGVLARLPVGERTIRYVSTVEHFRDLIVHPAPVESVPWEGEFRVSFRHVEPMSKGRIHLVGDAAHIHSPIGGRGMNLGIEDACWLAWLISEGREAEYSALRMPAVRMVLAETFRLTRLVLMRNKVALALRNSLMPLLMRIPRLRKQGLKSVLGLDTPSAPWLAASRPLAKDDA